MKIRYCFVLLFFALFAKLDAQLKPDSGLAVNGFIGAGLGVYKGVGQQYALRIPPMLHASFKLRKEALTVWAFSQYMSVSLLQQYSAQVSSNGLLLGSGYKQGDFTVLFAGGLGAIFSKQYFNGGIISSSKINAKPYVRGYNQYGFAAGFHLAFDGEYARFGLQFNIELCQKMKTCGLVVIGCEFGKR